MFFKITTCLYFVTVCFPEFDLCHLYVKNSLISKKFVTFIILIPFFPSDCTIVYKVLVCKKISNIH